MWTHVLLLSAFLLLLLLVYWYNKSFHPYEPNHGLKFPLPPKELYPFKHRWMSFDIHRKNQVKHIDKPTDTTLPCVHYIDVGRDKQKDAKNDICFLLCHGNPTWSFLYRKMIKTLSQQYRCVSIDCPGFGLSTAPKQYSFSTQQQADILLQVVEKLQLNNMVLVQQDWGGPTGFSVALNTSGKVRGFVIGNTFCWRISRLQRPDVYAFSCVWGGAVGRALGYGYNFAIRNFFREGFYKKLDKEIRYWYDVPFKGKYSRHGTWTWPAQIWDAYPLLKVIEEGIPEKFGKSVPCLLCWGMKDIAFKKLELNRFRTMFVDHEVFELKQGSHFWQEDQGEEAADYMLKWAKEKFS